MHGPSKRTSSVKRSMSRTKIRKVSRTRKMRTRKSKKSSKFFGLF